MARFTTRIATDANEPQAAVAQQERARIDFAVVGTALPTREKKRITTILHQIAQQISWCLLQRAQAPNRNLLCGTW